MLHPPVCILTAGKGLRMSPLTAGTNKAILPLAGKAIISHIIERFPVGSEFIIGLGFQGEQVRDYLGLAHPDTAFTFFTIGPYEGSGSGPGYSLWCCRSALQRPFFFVPCDALFETDLTRAPDTNWIGVATVDPTESAAYCNMRAEDGRVAEIRDKQPCDSRFRAFTGVLYVRDYPIFWEALREDVRVHGERQVSIGLTALMRGPGLVCLDINWKDLGDYKKYRTAIGSEELYDFSKTDEFIYFINGRVIKYFSDPKVVARRVEKAKLAPTIFPAIDAVTEQFYAYPRVHGETLYRFNNPVLFKRLLTWLETVVWRPVGVTPERTQTLCRIFYQDKTQQRLNSFSKKYPGYREPEFVNGERVLSVSEILGRLPWETLTIGQPVFMHGDLQFDNILYDQKGDRFVLIDWRQDFAGEVSFGDLYYDLAKLLGGIILNYDLVKLGLFTVYEQQSTIFIDFAQRFSNTDYQAILTDYIASKALDVVKVRMLAGLIYLNMAPLHHPPFDKGLHALGRLILTRQIAGSH